MKIVRWIARALSLLFVIFHIVSFLGDRSVVTLTTSDKISLTLWAILIIGMVIAWKWELLGSLIIIGGFIIQAVINPRILSMWAMWIAPFTGALFLISWVMDRKKSEFDLKTE